MQTFLQDLRLAIRGWRQRPGLQAVVVLTLALGISATAVVFSVVDAVLLRPLPFAAPERLGVVRAGLPGRQRSNALLAGPELTAIAEGVRTLRAVGAVWARPGVLRDAERRQSEEIEVGWVTPGFFETLASPPLFGRLPTPDEQERSPDVIVLSHPLWQRRFNGDLSVIGRRIDFDAEPRTVVGVMPPAFRMLLPPDQGVADDIDAWLPWGPGMSELSREFRVFTPIARLADGATWSQANAELRGLAAAIGREHVGYARSGFELRVDPLPEGIVAHAIELWLAVEPRLAPLRDDPRWPELVRRMAFPPSAG